MQQRRLADADAVVGAIGLGAMPLLIEGRPDEAQAMATVHAALDAGVTLVDTADAYCLASLRALGVEAVGLYQLHRPDPPVPDEELPAGTCQSGKRPASFPTWKPTTVPAPLPRQRQLSTSSPPPAPRSPTG